MNRRVLDENLRRMGLTPAWLEKQLRNQCIHGPEEVYLALCDDKRRLICYRMDEGLPGQ